MKSWFSGVMGVFLLGLVLAIKPFPIKGLQGADQDRPPGWRFGIIESYEDPDQADRLGVGWTRVGFHWAEAQPDGPDSWVMTIDDELLASELEAGRMVMGMLIGIPDWAQDAEGLPQGLWLPSDAEENYWANYVRQTVSRYKGRIDHWVIWNEPDIPAGEIAHTWHGTVADFAQLQKTAYLAAKEANPSAVVHLSAFTYWADYYAGNEQYLARLLAEFEDDPQAADQNYYFDIATAHLYFQPNQIFDLINLFRDIMRQHGLEKPIWLVETNAPPIDDQSWPVSNWTLSVTTREQAAFMPQSLAAALAAGAERVAVYKLRDTEEDRQANPEPFGLIRMDGTPREAFNTYRIAIKLLSEAFNVERERWDEVGQIRFDQPGQSTTVVFSRLPAAQEALVPATADFASLIDMFGTSKTITTTNGSFAVDLPGARCSQSIGDYCMIGGYTYYLVQESDRLPPTPTATASQTPPVTQTPVGTQTPMPSATMMAIPSTPTTSALTATAFPAAGEPPKTVTVDPTRIDEVAEARTPEPEIVFTGEAPADQRPENERTALSLVAAVGVTLVLAAGIGWALLQRRK